MSVSIKPVIAELENLYQYMVQEIGHLYYWRNDVKDTDLFSVRKDPNRNQGYYTWPNHRSYWDGSFVAREIWKALDNGEIQAPVFIIESNTKRNEMAWYNSDKWNSTNNQALHAISGLGNGDAGEIVINAKLLKSDHENIFNTVFLMSYIHMIHETKQAFLDIAEGKKYWPKSLRWTFQHFGWNLYGEADGNRGYRDYRPDRTSFIKYLMETYTPLDKDAFEVFTKDKITTGTGKGSSPLKKWACNVCDQSIRSSKKNLLIKCGACPGNPDYEYVDHDREDYYSNVLHKRDLMASGTCKFCNKDPNTLTNNWWYVTYICVP